MTTTPASDSSPAAKPAPLLHIGHPESHIPFFDPPDFPSKPATKKFVAILFVGGVLAALLGYWLEHLGENATVPDVPAIWMLPFAALLFCIATMPFIAKHFWEKNYQWVSIGLAALVTLYYCFFLHAGPSMAGSYGEYISFICLLGSLFIVSGGILIRIRRKATPIVNVCVLLVGAILANVFGTTGASMLLIRPYLRMNKGHIRPYHVVFFIFAVSNLGGALTPIGDPPLFLGYLKGVPFWWVAEHCWMPWSVGVGALLAVFFVFDFIHHRKDERAPHDPEDLGPVTSVFGSVNILFISIILIGVFLQSPFREIMMVTGACLSLLVTPYRIHRDNLFNYAPIKEVSLLFVGIFATMVPALNYLNAHANDAAFKKHLETPGQFYFASGTLSSVLDNAPTYMTFLETELGKIDGSLKTVLKRIVDAKNQRTILPADIEALKKLNPERYADPATLEHDLKILDEALVALEKYHGEKVANGTLNSSQIELGFLLGDRELNWYIVAISLGSVFFGAMTYIGNGPNFMVKSIAEQNMGSNSIKCPSFFGYIFRYSLPILLPILLLIWAIFLAPHGGH